MKRLKEGVGGRGFIKRVGQKGGQLGKVEGCLPKGGGRRGFLGWWGGKREVGLQSILLRSRERQMGEEGLKVNPEKCPIDKPSRENGLTQR